MMDMCEDVYQVPWQAVYIVCTRMKKIYYSYMRSTC